MDNHPRSVGELMAAVAGGSGRTVKYLHFWGHTPPRDKAPGPHFLSQWWPSPFTVDGVTYPTAEHWMMAGKARLFGDDEALQRILKAPHAGAAKTEGRLVKGFDDTIWQQHRFDLVVQGNTAKFSHHPELRDYLLATGDRVLAEASPVDRVWGIGLTADDPRACDPSAWRGLNLLGFALMDAREALRGTARP